MQPTRHVIILPCEVPPAPGRSPHSTRADQSQAPCFKAKMLTAWQPGSVGYEEPQAHPCSRWASLGLPGLGSNSTHVACVRRTATARGWPRWLRARLGRDPPAPPPWEPGQASSLGQSHA